jgi:hypothetical protein
VKLARAERGSGDPRYSRSGDLRYIKLETCATLSGASLGVLDGDDFGFLRDYLDFEKLGPELSGDEEAVVHGVVGDAVEDGFGIGDFAGF